MTMPILSGATPVDAAPGHPTTALPPEAQVATIAAEFRTALSTALGGTIRSRRGRADGPREVVTPVPTTGQGRTDEAREAVTTSGPVTGHRLTDGPGDAVTTPRPMTGQGRVESSALSATTISEGWPRSSKDAELLTDSAPEGLASTATPKTSMTGSAERSTGPATIAAEPNDEESISVDETQSSKEAEDSAIPGASHGETVVAPARGASETFAFRMLPPTPVAPAHSPEVTSAAHAARPDVAMRDVAASDVVRTLATLGTSIRRDRHLLHPEFDTKLGRVLERMQSEYGLTVEVVETHRTQQRQDTLFAQGRTSPGPIVTWTRHSNHTEGLAADVTVNGGWSDKAGFERLARVAKEEGLATLWPRDPGHIELPSALLEDSRREPNKSLPLPHSAATGVPRSETGIPHTTGDLRSLPVTEHPLRKQPIGENLARTLPIDVDDVSTLPMPPGADGRRIREARIRALTDAVLGETPVARSGRTSPDDSAVDLIRDLTPRPLAALEGRQPTPVPTGIATVARVAEVASVAAVAKVAQVQAPAAGTPLPREAEKASRREQVTRRTPAEELTSVLASLVRGEEDQPTHRPSEHTHDRVAAPTRPRVAASITEREPRVELSNDREAKLLPDVSPEQLTERPQPAFMMDRGAETRTERTGAGIEAITRTDATERIARALKLQDAQQEMPVSSLTLRLDHPEGGEDRIRIDLRGSTIGARLDIADPVAAENLRLHTNELQHALESRGLEGESIAVRSLARVAETNQTAAALAGSEREGLRASGTQGGQSSAQGHTRDQRQSPRGEDLSRDSHHPSSRQQRDARGNRR